MTEVDNETPVTGTFTRRRSGSDIVVGVLLILAAVVILGDAVLATIVSVRVLGWLTVVAGVLMLVGSWRRRHGRRFLSAALGGVGLLVLGVYIVRNPLIGALSLTLLAGSLFLTTGLVRVVTATQAREDRLFMILSGLLSLGLGVFVLLNLVGASFTLLGVLLGIQTLIEGMTLLVAGRLRRVAPAPAGAATGA